MRRTRQPIVAAIVATASAVGPAAGQQPVGAACGDVLATLPLLGTAMQAVTEESLRSQIARFTLPPGVTGTDIFACLCGRDPARDFFTVVEDMAVAGQEDLAACVETTNQEAQGAVVVVGPRPDAGADVPDLPATDGSVGTDRWAEYSDADLRALMQLDPALLVASLDATAVDLRAELGQRLVDRWQEAELDARLSAADLRFVLEDVHAGTASVAMMDVLAQEIDRRRAVQPTAVVRGRLVGGGEPTIETSDRASTHFDGWSDAALAGLMLLEATDAEALAGYPRRVVAEELARRLLDRPSPAGTAAEPTEATEGEAEAEGTDDAPPVEVVHGAPREAPPPPLSPARVVRTDVEGIAPSDAADAALRLADCLETMAPAELTPLLRSDPDGLIRHCAQSE